MRYTLKSNRRSCYFRNDMFAIIGFYASYTDNIEDTLFVRLSVIRTVLRLRRLGPYFHKEKLKIINENSITP